MASPIVTKGMTSGNISTTHKPNESVAAWVARHNSSVSQGTPGNTLTTEWECASGQESERTDRAAGESDADFILRHEAQYMLAMDSCPPVP